MISKDRQTAVIIIVIINIMQQVLCRVPLQVSKSQKSMGPNVGRYQWVVVQQVVEKWCIERLCLGNLKKKLKKKKSAEITVWLQPGRIMNELAIFVNKSDFGIYYGGARRPVTLGFISVGARGPHFENRLWRSQTSLQSMDPYHKINMNNKPHTTKSMWLINPIPQNPCDHSTPYLKIHVNNKLHTAKSLWSLNSIPQNPQD